MYNFIKLVAHYNNFHQANNFTELTDAGDCTAIPLQTKQSEQLPLVHMLDSVLRLELMFDYYVLCWTQLVNMSYAGLKCL